MSHSPCFRYLQRQKTFVGHRCRSTLYKACGHAFSNSSSCRRPGTIMFSTMASTQTSSITLASTSEEHAATQRITFDNCYQEFLAPLRPQVQERLQRTAASVPGLGPHSRVVDVGSGTGALIPYVQECGVSDVLAVDLSPAMLAALTEQFPPAPRSGNVAAVRTWCGDILSVPTYMGSADAVFFNAVFGNLYNQYDALLHCCLCLLKSGGHIVISHPEGRGWLSELRRQNPVLVPHELPDLLTLQSLIKPLPLRLVDYTDEQDYYCAVLQVPPSYRLTGPRVRLSGLVVPGAGRGSKQMGVPTANIDVDGIRDTLANLNKGVYFGWAQLPRDSGAVHKMVVNVGDRPTLNDGRDITCEVHIMHTYPHDFYGQELRVVLAGYIRPEVRFSDVGALVARIRTDVALARYSLDDPALQVLASDELFVE